MATVKFPFLRSLALLLLLGLSTPKAYAVDAGAPAQSISQADLDMLAQVEKDSMRYFIRMSDKVTGLTKDSSRAGSPASIAATGFALAAIAIGADRGWIDPDHAYEQLRKTLKTLVTKAHHQNGFYYHFLDPRSGRRVWTSEASSIDTALLVAGALVAAQYYPGTNVERMAMRIYERVDWPWMMNNSSLICMGWNPEGGFLPYYWDSYNEHLIIQALAIGSPSHPIPASSWKAWLRPEESYNGKDIIYAHSGSLFTYEFPQAFIDFRHLNDNGINYFDNSVKASQANWEYSQAYRGIYKTYTPSSWGLSASVGPGGYKAYGAKPGVGYHDGTIAPYAAISSIVFTPFKSIKAVRHFWDEYQKQLYGYYGFKDAFNVDKNWWAQEYLGIDQGITVLMLENFLNDGAIWHKFMDLHAIQRWIRLCGLSEGAASKT